MSKLLPHTHFLSHEALRSWLLKHLKQPSIRRALERGTMNVLGTGQDIAPQKRPGILIKCMSPLGGIYHLMVVHYPNGLQIIVVDDNYVNSLVSKQLQQWLSPDRGSEQ